MEFGPLPPYRVAVEERDRPHYLQLLRQLGVLDGWLARIDPTASRPEPQRGSPLRADDDMLDPYHLSHAAWHSLSHAVDHLHCLRSLLQDARVIHMYAPYSLVRAALENACAAVWMLQPPRRADRLERRLRFAVTDIRSGEETKRLIGQTGPRSEQDRMDQLRDIARRAGVAESALKRGALYSEIVKTAGSNAWNGVITFAVSPSAARDGARPAIQMDRRGHAMQGMDQIYTHVTPEMRQQLCEVLEKLWQDAVAERRAVSPHSGVPLLDRILTATEPAAPSDLATQSATQLKWRAVR